MPRARLNTPDGKTTEWKSKALRAYQRRTLVADALIAGAYLAGTNTRRVRRALAALLPAGEPHVRHARGVVGVIVGKKLHIDFADRKLELYSRMVAPRPASIRKLLVAGLDQGAGTARRHVPRTAVRAIVVAGCTPVVVPSSPALAAPVEIGEPGHLSLL